MNGRAQRLLERLEETGIDVLLVSDLANLRYLTGFTGSNGMAVIGRDCRRFATDFRYVEQAAQQVDSTFDRTQVAHDPLRQLGELLPSGPLRLGFEPRHLSVAEHTQLREGLSEDIELVPVQGAIEALRQVKEADEIERIRAAAALADDALRSLLDAGLAGRSEREAALELEVAMRRRGAERPSFPPIVAAGANGALPHAGPRDVEIRSGDLVVIDWGAELDGYCSDCTRTLAVGAASDEARAIYDLVLEAQLAGLAAARAGALCRDVDTAARGIIDTAGHGREFGHGLGHGVGLEVHEQPRLAPSSDGELAMGNVVTVEPGVYIPGEFGVRIEDLVVIGADGAEILTGISKDLTVVE